MDNSQLKADIQDGINFVSGALNDETEFNRFFDGIFRSADNNNSGDLDFDEFYRDFGMALSQIKVPCPSKEEARVKFDQLDTDKSDNLSKAEYRVLIREIFVSWLALLQQRLSNLQ